jgi:hypothetical protein
MADETSDTAATLCRVTLELDIAAGVQTFDVRARGRAAWSALPQAMKDVAGARLVQAILDGADLNASFGMKRPGTRNKGMPLRTRKIRSLYLQAMLDALAELEKQHTDAAPDDLVDSLLDRLARIGRRNPHHLDSVDRALLRAKLIHDRFPAANLPATPRRIKGHLPARNKKR